MGQHTQARLDMLIPLQGVATSSNTIPSASRSKETSDPSSKSSLLRLIVKQWVNQSFGSCQLCKACRIANLHGVSLREPCTQLRVLQEAGSSTMPACRRLVSATLTAYGRSPPDTRRRSNRPASGPTQALQRGKKQKPTLLIAARNGHIHMVAEQNVPLKDRPLLDWARKESSSWPYCIPGSRTARSETPKATRS